mgnify:CR=1 FL=1
MIHIYITGQIANKKKVEQYCVDCLHHFFKGRLKRDIDVDVRFSKHLIDKSHGGCYGDHTSVVLEIAKGMIDDSGYMPFDYKEIIVTLAHEIVHAKQHIRKEWHKQSKDNISQAETEAYDLEYVLYDKYWN